MDTFVLLGEAASLCAALLWDVSSATRSRCWRPSARAPASVAAVLLSTSPIFSLFIDHWTAGTPLTLRGLAGTAVAVSTSM